MVPELLQHRQSTHDGPRTPAAPSVYSRWSPNSCSTVCLLMMVP
ncbi:hypothetical protein LSAT2_024552, partial [Lamellibrachia satsuma]